MTTVETVFMGASEINVRKHLSPLLYKSHFLNSDSHKFLSELNAGSPGWFHQARLQEALAFWFKTGGKGVNTAPATFSPASDAWMLGALKWTAWVTDSRKRACAELPFRRQGPTILPHCKTVHDLRIFRGSLSALYFSPEPGASGEFFRELIWFIDSGQENSPGRNWGHSRNHLLVFCGNQMRLDFSPCTHIDTEGH